jgi:hypothetical protein
MTRIECPKPRPLSYLEAAQLLRRHGIDPSEAFAELGHYPVYEPEEIWSWLPEKSA